MSVFEGFRFRRVFSPVHQLDPRVKFFYVCAIFVIAVMFNQLLPLILLFLIQLPFILVAGVQKEWVRSMKGASFLAVMIFLFNFVFTYFYREYPMFPPSSQLIEYALAMTLRFLVLVESFSVFFLTTSPDRLGLALEQSHIPYEFCFAFTTAVRFVPVLAEEAQTIMDAQKARGLELAEAMESRAWGATDKRTNLYVLKIKRGDYILVMISVVMLILAAYIWLFMRDQIPSLVALLTA